MNKKTKKIENRPWMNILTPWASAFLFLLIYYSFIQFPMERSFIKGLNYLNQNKALEASQEFKKVIRVFPKYEPVYLNVANYFLQNGHLKQSMSYWEYSRRICLLTAEIFTERGLVYSKYRLHLDDGIVFYNDHVQKYYLSKLFPSDEKE